MKQKGWEGRNVPILAFCLPTWAGTLVSAVGIALLAPCDQAFGRELEWHQWLFWVCNLRTVDHGTFQCFNCMNQFFIINLFLYIYPIDWVSLPNSSLTSFRKLALTVLQVSCFSLWFSYRSITISNSETLSITLWPPGIVPLSWL